MLTSWFGIDPTQKDGSVSRLKIGNLIGRYATVIVTTGTHNGKTSQKITEVLPPMPNVPVINSTFDVRNIPAFIQRMIDEQIRD